MMRRGVNPLLHAHSITVTAIPVRIEGPHGEPLLRAVHPAHRRIRRNDPVAVIGEIGPKTVRVGAQPGEGKLKGCTLEIAKGTNSADATLKSAIIYGVKLLTRIELVRCRVDARDVVPSAVRTDLDDVTANRSVQRGIDLATAGRERDISDAGITQVRIRRETPQHVAPRESEDP